MKKNIVLSLELSERLVLKRILEDTVKEYEGVIAESNARGEKLAVEIFNEEKKVIVDILGELE